jgi:trehalose-phosphatase
MSDLEAALESIATAPVLLVASDYDGTLARIVRDPAEAKPVRDAIAALRTLAGLARTHVAVISGRARGELARLADFPDGVHLVGSHGGEFDSSFGDTLPPGAVRLREQLFEAVTAIAAGGSGMTIERKPAGVAFHYRNADEAEAERALERILRGPGALPGVHARSGKKVVELGVIETSKGDAVASLRRRFGASAVLFLGDDTTDEDAFATLGGADVGIKVGDGQTRAGYRVRGPEQAAEVLARLGADRARWAARAKEGSAPP